MNEQLISLILACVILIGGFIFVGNMLFGRRGGGHGMGCFGQFFSEAIFGFIRGFCRILFEAYKRAFIVCIEFVSGVHDWPSYRTSSFKYLGILFAFLGFNGVILGALPVIALLVAAPSQIPQTDASALLSTLIIFIGGPIVCLVAARFFLRRMP